MTAEILSSLLTAAPLTSSQLGDPSFLEDLEFCNNFSSDTCLSEQDQERKIQIDDNELQQLLELNSTANIALNEDWSSFNWSSQDYDALLSSDTSGSPVNSFPSTPASVNQPLLNLDQEINDMVFSLEDHVCYHALSPLPHAPEYQQTVPTTTILPFSPFSPLSPSPLSPSPSPSPCTESVSKTKSSIKLSSKDRKMRKKSQNRSAALRYRQKKKDELEELSSKERSLEKKNKELKNEVENLVNEIQYLKRLWSEVNIVKCRKSYM